MVIDTRYRSKEVQRWAAQRQPQVICAFGDAQYRSLQLLRRSELKDFPGVESWIVDAGLARDELYLGRLAKRAPEDRPTLLPDGHWGLPEDVSNDYLRALVSWERRETFKNGRLQFLWHSRSPGREHWADCEVEQVACMDRWRLAQKAPPAETSEEPRDAAPPRPVEDEDEPAAMPAVGEWKR